MEVLGLEKNYYLAGNDIYIKVRNTATPSTFLDVEVSNETTGVTLGALRPYPDLNNEYHFNICLPIRALMPEPEDINNPNSLNRMAIRIKATLNDGTSEATTITKYFIRGGRDKNGAAEWNLNDGDVLAVGNFPKFVGIPELPNGIHRIVGDKIKEYVPPFRQHVMLKDTCNPTYVRFLNSLGGYQWWVFEQRVDYDDSKAGKSKISATFSLKQNRERQLTTQQGRDLTLLSDMPIEFYDVAVELINSTDIYIYDPNAPKGDINAQYERVLLRGTNKVERNTVARRVDFQLNLTLPTYINRDI